MVSQLKEFSQFLSLRLTRQNDGREGHDEHVDGGENDAAGVELLVHGPPQVVGVREGRVFDDLVEAIGLLFVGCSLHGDHIPGAVVVDVAAGLGDGFAFDVGLLCGAVADEVEARRVEVLVKDLLLF